MKKEIDLYNYPKRMKQSLILLKESKISSRNKEWILAYRDHTIVKGLSMPRVIRYLTILRDWAIFLKKDFDIVNKEDMTKAVRILQDIERYSPWTKATYKIMIKTFYKWLRKNDNPEETAWISTTIKRTEKVQINNGDLISEEDIKTLINAADHIRDKAIIAVLYESGCRIGEIGSLQLNNIKSDPHGILMTVNGKTGPRNVRVIFSVPYLLQWLDVHPLKANRLAPLWINIGTRNHLKTVEYETIRRMMQNLFIKTKIKKRFNPHMFRHSRATYLADHLTEFQMNQYFGWIQGSKMPATYVHMSGKKIEDSILSLNGIQTESVKKESTLKPKICVGCGTINTFDAVLCTKCGNIVDTRTATEVQTNIQKQKEVNNISSEVMDTLSNDPEVLGLLIKKMKELNLTNKLQNLN